MELEWKEMTLAVGVSKRLSEEMLMGRDIPHFKQFIRKELEKEMRLNTSHATAETEAGMVVTRSKQRQQDALEEEEQLGLEEDGAVLRISKWGGGDTTEACGEDWMEEQSSDGFKKDIQPDECSVEVPGEDQTRELSTEGDGVSEEIAGVTTEVFIKKKLAEAQRYESDLQSIREKAEGEGNPYFWHGGL